ncbi:MAG: CpsD/CapB family tyrosine-protein kinase [Chloroflexales bacterium]|nr:CpsD/CapB family tyrosine-protein kinase [Chloroflexales bacterium]
MLKLRKKTQAASQYSAPLTLEAANGALQRTFDAVIVDNFRRMTTDLVCNGGLPQRIVVASALQGEGVTYTALALATTLASDTADRYCVLDLNWWAPGIIAQLDPAQIMSAAQRGHKAKAAAAEKLSETIEAMLSRPGIAQVVAGKATIDEAIIPTALPNLCLLPAGALAIEERPVLARSAGLRTLLNDVSERFNYLILDVPPILTTSDAIALASLGDACCMVVRHGVTPTPTVQRALDHVKHLKMLGIILNQVAIKTPSWLRMLIPQE